MTYTGNMVESLAALVKDAEEKRATALSGYQMFPMFLPCWHPAKQPVDQTLEMCGRKDA